MLAYLKQEKLPAVNQADPEKNENTNPHFYVHNASTGEIRDLGISVFGEFSWSSDSSHIIYSGRFAHEIHDIAEVGIFIVDIDGKETEKLSSIGSSGSPVISQSGKYILWDSFDYDTFFLVENPYQL